MLSLSFIPYAVSVPDISNVYSSNKVLLGQAVQIEGGINSSAVVLIRPVNDSSTTPFNKARIGTELTVADKLALANESSPIILPTDVKYEYSSVNLDEIRFTVTTGTIVKVVSGANGGGVVDSYYQFKVKTNGESILLEKENYGDTNRWEILTTVERLANSTTGVAGRPTIAQVEADGVFYQSNATLELRGKLVDQLYVIKPVAMERPTISYRNLGTLLFEQREKIVGWIASHATNAEAVARYQVQLAALDATLADLGLVQTATNIVNGTTITQTVVNKNLDALFIDLPSIYAAPGSVFIEADNVYTRNGTDETVISNQPLLTQIKAQGGAKIEIDNKSPFAMTVADAVIRDNKRVTVVDGEYTVQQAGNVYLNNTALTTVNDTSARTVKITQKALDPLIRYSIDGLSAQRGSWLVHRRRYHQRGGYSHDQELRRQHQRGRRSSRGIGGYSGEDRFHPGYRRLAAHEP